MKSSLSPYLRKHILFTLGVALAGILILSLLPSAYRTPAFPWLILFFFAVNALVQIILLRASEKKFSNFVNYFLVSSFLKLLLYIIVLVIYIFLHKEDALPFTITFFILYLVFTANEVFTLLSKDKNKEGKQN